MKARRGELEGVGCEAHEEKVRARIEREKERRNGRAQRVAAGKEKKRAQPEAKRLKDEARANGLQNGHEREVERGVVKERWETRGQKRHASAEPDKEERKAPQVSHAANGVSVEDGVADEEAAFNGA